MKFINDKFFLMLIKLMTPFLLFISKEIKAQNIYSAQAISAQQAIKIDLSTAIKMTLQHSFNLKAAKSNFDSADYDYKSSVWNLAPTVTLNSNLTWSQNNSSGDYNIPQNSPSSSSSATVTVTQSILGLISSLHTLNQKEISYKINKLLYEQETQQSALIGASSFLNAQLAAQKLENAMASFNVVKKSLDDSLALYETGSIYRDDLLRIKLQFSIAEQNLNYTKIESETALYILAQTMGLNSTQYKIIMPDNNLLLEEKQKSLMPKLEEAKKIAFNNNKDLQLAFLKTQNAEASKTVYFDNYLPSLNAFASFTKNFFPNSSSANLSQSADNTISYGFQFSWTIWDWGLRWQKNNSLIELIQSSKYSYYSLKEQLDLQVTQQYFAIQNFKNSLKSAEEGLKFAKETLNLVNIRYLNGQVQALDLITSQQALSAAQSTRTQACYDLFLALVKFDITLGLTPK